MTHDANNIFLWDNFSQHPPEVQREMLREFELLLPRMTVKEQVDSFMGAPEDIILKYLGQLAWESQVAIWKRVLPVGARKDARKLLSYDAETALKLRKRSMCLA